MNPQLIEVCPAMAPSLRSVIACALFLPLAACGGGGDDDYAGPGTPPPEAPANRAPVAHGDALRADDAELGSIDVLGNDTDADGDTLTVEIESAAIIGTARVNEDGTVAIDGLPPRFKGLTRFEYRVTDPDGESAVAAAAVFVGVEPFRVLFAGEAATGVGSDIYLADFVEPALAVATAAGGDMRLRGFASSEDGSTVAYRRENVSSAGTSDLHFVRIGETAAPVPVELPPDAALVQDVDGQDQYRVSSDGQWIALVAEEGGAEAVNVLSVAAPQSIREIRPPGAVHASQLRFSSDSRGLYFLGSGDADGDEKSLYFVTLDDPSPPALVSALAVPGSADDVLEYSVSPDQSRILLRANRGGQVGLYFVDPLTLQTETRVSHALGLGDTLLESTLSLDPFHGGSTMGSRVAYTVRSLLTFTAYVAEVSATPTPRTIATNGARAIGFRPDDAAVLFSRSGQVYEAIIDAPGSPEAIGVGGFGWYDSTGNIVLMRQYLPSGGSPSTYPALAVAVRGSFGTTTPVGTPVLASHFVDVSGFDRGVALIGEGETTGAAPTTARLALVNAISPERLVYLADFVSPLDLTSAPARVVTGQ
jgi:hypothetical protein